jgi:hypothetical protein
LPIARPTPDLAATALAVNITGTAPRPQRYNPGTPEFRYWTAAEALRRVADFWSPLLPAATSWHSTVGTRLRVRLDAGVDLNAYYDRAGLEFFHDSAGRLIVYSGESPDVVCHEFGHALLDALRPQLWDAATAEVAAFHESFGDISALLSALQLPSVRTRVLLDTQNRLYRSSQLSRLAEQLGWAIRLTHPDSVETDCLRNAVNSFFYKDPQTLPPSAPASLLSSESHSFSRVFTGAFFEGLAGILAALGPVSEASLQQATVEAGKLLVKAITSAPVVPSYYSQIAGAMVGAAQPQFQQALAGAFMKHGILSPESAQLAAAPRPDNRRAIAANSMVTSPSLELPRMAIPVGEYGLGVETILVRVASQPKSLSVAGAAASVGSVNPPAHDEAAKSFIEDLIRLGRIDLGQPAAREARNGFVLAQPQRRKTHELKRTAEGMVLNRLHFDCGFDCSCTAP